MCAPADDLLKLRNLADDLELLAASERDAVDPNWLEDRALCGRVAAALRALLAEHDAKERNGEGTA